MVRPVERLSHRQRELTPPAFASWLVAEVRRRCDCYTVAALWVRHDSPYWSIDGVECYDVLRDAYTYQGPHPVICHPPCGPWGRYRAVSRQDRQAGLHAIDLAGLYGGVIEQPASSLLLRGGQVVDQFDWGHPSIKATRLVWFPRPCS